MNIRCNRLNDVCAYLDNRPPHLQRVNASNKIELEDLVQSISLRVGGCLERQGLLTQDTESAWLELDPAEPQILGSSISYRIAVSSRQVQRAFMIRNIRPLDTHDSKIERVIKTKGFLHAGVSCKGVRDIRKTSVSAYTSIYPDRP